MDEVTVLVVDDSPSVRETLAYLLAREGFDVHTAVNGRDGYEAILRLRPVAVLLDAMMPDIDGFDVCRQVKAQPDLEHITIIMLTAMGQKADEIRAREAGVDAFLTKPPDIARTIALIREACGQAAGAMQ